jgi:hypothetical protein
MEAAKQVHAKAYCLVKYRSTDGMLEEQIWNSRGSAAPFVVYARNAKRPLLRAHSWTGRSSASRQPRIGDRIFVDTTLADVTAYKRRMVESEWGNPEFQRIIVKSLVRKLGDNPSPLSIAQHLAKCHFQRYPPPGPELIVVGESVLEWLKGESAESENCLLVLNAFHAEKQGAQPRIRGGEI